MTVSEMASKGGKARCKALTKARRIEIATNAANIRHHGKADKMPSGK